MSKASRRKNAGRKSKIDTIREANGRPSRVPSAERMRQHVLQARARKSAITGRDDMPIDVLGILHGHKHIEDAEYNIGRKLARLMNRIYGSPTEAPSSVFDEAITPPNDEDAMSAPEAMSEEDATALFLKMDQTLLRCGRPARDLVVGASWLGRFPATLDQANMIIEGLKALAKGHAPKAKERPELVRKAA